jgi:hypothetical protein
LGAETKNPAKSLALVTLWWSAAPHEQKGETPVIDHRD